MRKTIAIGILGLALVTNRAAAQTAVEQAQILRDFQRSVVDYTQRETCLFHEATTAAAPAPKVFTLPVAIVFRQLIGNALAAPDGVAIGGVATTHRATALQTIPAAELYDFPKRLAEVLPLLPAPLEYRLVDNDLVIRDAAADMIVAVLPHAVGAFTARR
jgi:hypothetical protein